MKTFKILGLLLTYPEGSLFQALDEIIAILNHEAVLDQKKITSIKEMIQKQKTADLLLVQEKYVETFDRGRAHCLHLFEHIHGESRDRGQAMVDLTETYAAKGLIINHSELPDYLPLFLEYLSLLEFKEASELLSDAINVIAMIGSKLKKNQSPYFVIFDAIVALSAVKPDEVVIKKALESVPKDPETFEELDEQWKEAEAFDGTGTNNQTNCNSCSIPTQTKSAQKQNLGGIK